MDVISLLGKVAGSYQGDGVNHEGEAFSGFLTIAPVLNGKGIEILYQATGVDGACFHQEKTIVAKNFSGNLKMWNLNTNSPGMAELELRYATKDIIFGVGNPNNKSEFREEIKIELDNETIGYHYSWGIPGGDFEYRSGLRMKRFNAST